MTHEPIQYLHGLAALPPNVYCHITSPDAGRRLLSSVHVDGCGWTGLPWHAQRLSLYINQTANLLKTVLSAITAAAAAHLPAPLTNVEWARVKE